MEGIFKEGWKDQLLEEAKALNKRTKQLETFLLSSKAYDLEYDQKIMLEEQLECMRKYLEVLALRIGYFIANTF